MIRRVMKLTDDVFSYIQKEKNYNTYIISDLEILGLDSGIIELYCGIDNDEICYVLLKYGQSFVLYSENVIRINISEIKYFMDSIAFDFRITGKREVIEKIAECFPKAEVEHNQFATMTKEMLEFYSVEGDTMQLIKNCNVEQVISGYSFIDEYKKKYEERGNAVKRIETNNLNGRYYGLESEGKIVAMVCSAAESKELAMISEVGTALEYRNRGLSKILVSNLCKDLFDMGKKELSIFYSNPVAKRVYETIGFKESGEYSMLINCSK